MTTTPQANPKPLSTYFTLNRRYYRSVNLERDLDKPDAVRGYILTERSAASLTRILSALHQKHSHRAWTLTGVYGTGKSAFAHYLACLGRSVESPVHTEAVKIADYSFEGDSETQEAIAHLPKQGLMVAVATGRNEPLSWSITRALAEGADRFWSEGEKPDFLKVLNSWRFDVANGSCAVNDADILSMLQRLAKAAKTSILLILDELGKNLEFAAYNKGVGDLYLLQQIAELNYPGEEQVYFLGLLHQSFGGYCDRLSTTEQNEWTKIQGRFEDIPFIDSPSQMTRLMGQAIQRREKVDEISMVVHNAAQDWFSMLETVLAEQEISVSLLEKIYPLHPLVGLVLPQLCTRYAQNDRSLFTFLTSDEPYGFREFLDKTSVQEDDLPTLKLYQVYDYFVETVTGLTSRFNLQRWAEIQGLIQDARDRSLETLNILKTIGVLNLVTSTGALRATPELVALALCDIPDPKTQDYWQQAIKDLQNKGLITYRSQLNELRIWEGSDFNVEAAIYEFIEQKANLAGASIAPLLEDVHPLKPVVAQRHYTITGTLRYFEQRYGDKTINLKTLTCSVDHFDGLIVYWLGMNPPEEIPTETKDGRPLILITISQLDELRIRGREFQALKTIKNAPELQNDGVARREVKQRLVEAKRLLDETLAQALDWSRGENDCYLVGEKVEILSRRGFQEQLSGLCDRIYHQHLTLDNELINRQELTSQGAKARRELITAMIEQGEQERLGFTGYGPEVSMYYSVLEATKIHRSEEGEWGFYPPGEGSGVETVWNAIEAFCLAAKDAQRPLNHLEKELAKPPFGVKRGVIPVLLAAVLLYRVDDVGVYRDGTFIPVLGAEHFELLLKNPYRFSVKYFEIVGLRSHVFKELEAIFRSPETQITKTIRNASLLAIAKPLFNFVQQLPPYTLTTQQLSPEARQVLQVLQVAQEPDEMLFTALPNACSLPSMTAEETDINLAKTYRKKLVQCLHEIQTAYDRLLSHCKAQFYEAFGVRKENYLREDLASRSSLLVGRCVEPVLKRFVGAAVEQNKSDQEWLESVVMIVGDKPARSWTDEDITRFELTLSDIVRRFQNLEALQTETKPLDSPGLTAKRITITQADGKETHQTVWIDNSLKIQAQEIAQNILSNLPDDLQLQKAVLTELNEIILNNSVE